MSRASARPPRPAGAVAILADLPGPKMRIGRSPRRPGRAAAGRDFASPADDVGGHRASAVTSPTSAGRRRAARATGSLLDDGTLETARRDVGTACAICRGRRRRARCVRSKGMNLPGVALVDPAAHREGPRRPRFAAASMASTSSRCRSCAGRGLRRAARAARRRVGSRRADHRQDREARGARRTSTRSSTRPTA